MRGTDQPCRMHEKTDVQKVDKLPSAPKFLSKFGKKIYRTQGEVLLKLGVLNEINIGSFAMLCSEISKYIELTMDLSNEGYTTVTLKGTFINPKAKLASDAYKNAKTLSVEFGMTPASFARIAAQFSKKKEESQMDKYLNA